MTGALTSQPFYETAANLLRRQGGEAKCTCCEKELTGAVRMLELDQRFNVYHDFCDVPAEHSQGWFPFGLKCAKRRLAHAIAVRGA